MGLIRKRRLISYDGGITTIDLAATAESQEWMKAGRLKDKIKRGGKRAKKAQAELDRMAATEMFDATED